MRLILIIVNQVQSKCGAISGMKNIRRVFSGIKLDKSTSLQLPFSSSPFCEDTRHSLFSQQTCRYDVMTFTAAAGSREKSHLFQDDNKFSLSVSLITSITLGGQIHITFPLYNFLIFLAAISEERLHRVLKEYFLDYRDNRD